MWLLPTKAILVCLPFYDIQIESMIHRPTVFPYCTTGKGLHTLFNYTPSSAMCISGQRSQSLYLDKDRVARGTDLGKCSSTDRTQTQEEGSSSIGYLAAFSGNLAGKNLHPYFVPPVYDLLQPQGFFKNRRRTNFSYQCPYQCIGR